MALPQCPVFFFQRIDTGEQFFDPLFQARELQVELRFCCICIVHEKDYGAALFARSITGVMTGARSRPCHEDGPPVQA